MKIVRLPKEEEGDGGRSSSGELAPLWPAASGSRKGSNGSGSAGHGKGSLPGRVSIEEDVLKEVEILKSLNQCVRRCGRGTLVELH